jgi:SAM-dependent methyltransferase
MENNSDLEFTGERFVPGQGDPQLLYEHLHRYLFASLFVAGKRVLDLGCGEGYGSYLLRREAQRVVGLDNALGTVRHAQLVYPLLRSHFICADGTKLPFRKESFDAVVAFEFIEHIEDQGAMLEEVARVLGPHGFLLISTPNKKVYSEDALYTNPFHVKEFYVDEFHKFLGQYFPEVTLFGQKILSTSFIWPLAPHAGVPFKLQVQPIASTASREALSDPTLPAEPVYTVALCAKQSLPSTASGYLSVLVDSANAFIENLNSETRRLNEHIQELGAWGKRLSHDVSDRDATISTMERELQGRSEWAKQLEAACQARDATIARIQEELQKRTEWARQLEAACQARDATIAELQSEMQTRTQWALQLDQACKQRDATIAAIKARWIYRVLKTLHLVPP